jgi:hypothetical protein
VQIDAHRAHVALTRPVRVPDVRAASGVLGAAFTSRNSRDGIAAQKARPNQPLARQRNHMKWIDDMFAGMENQRDPVPVERAGEAKVDRLKKPSPGALNAWNALLASITNDVNDFNKHKQRAGQTAVCMSQGPSQ